MKAKTVVKKVIKIVCFVLAFAVVFSVAQSVLHYRWLDEEDYYTRSVDYEKNCSLKLDVLYLGTSEVFSGIDPIVTFNEKGITGFNLAVKYKSAVTMYYQLLYALKHNTPKVVVCDFSSLFEDCLPSEEEAVYRRVYSQMPDEEIKSQLLNDILKIDSSQDYWSWKFQFFRYHSTWSSVVVANFLPDNYYDETYKTYAKGSRFVNRSEAADELFEISQVSRDDEPDYVAEYSELSAEYYTKFIEECKSRGIEVCGVIMPKPGELSQKEYIAKAAKMQEFLSANGAKCLNYKTFEKITEMGLDFQNHYYDIQHLNSSGAIVFSKVLAEDLSELYDLEDHRTDPAYASWTDSYELFLKEIPVAQTTLNLCLVTSDLLDVDHIVYVNNPVSLTYDVFSDALIKNEVVDEDSLYSLSVATKKGNERTTFGKEDFRDGALDTAFGKFSVEKASNGKKEIKLNGETVFSLDGNSANEIAVYVITLKDNEVLNSKRFAI